VTWASTSVVNLERDPVGCLVVSAFVTGGGILAMLPWLPLIVVALLGAVRAVGPVRAVLVCAAGHVIGTLVSEGIVAWRVDSGALPDSYRHLIDVGPSYVVVSALVITLVYASRQWRWLAVAGLVVMVFAVGIFWGLFSLEVAAVGHTTAIATTLAIAPFLRRGLLCRRQEVARPPTARPIT
jgi:hypothetical protein